MKSLCCNKEMTGGEEMLMCPCGAWIKRQAFSAETEQLFRIFGIKPRHMYPSSRKSASNSSNE